MCSVYMPDFDRMSLLEHMTVIYQVKLRSGIIGEQKSEISKSNTNEFLNILHS